MLYYKLSLLEVDGEAIDELSLATSTPVTGLTVDDAYTLVQMMENLATVKRISLNGKYGTLENAGLKEIKDLEKAFMTGKAPIQLYNLSSSFPGKKATLIITEE